MAGYPTSLAPDPGKCGVLLDKAKLYEGKILHWIYAGDSALHLAAAGYRA